MNVYLLSLLVFSPLLGIIMVALMPKKEERTIKQFGFFGTLPPLFLSFFLCSQYYSGVALSLFDIKLNWIRFGNLEMYDPKLFTVDFELGLDGLSLIFILLTTIISSLAAVASIYIKKEWKGYYLLFLILEIGMLGVFTAENLILFFIFFEMTLIPAFFLIGRWGFLEREKASYSFLIYNGIGSAVLLVAILILFARTGTTNIAALTQMMTMGGVSLFAPISGSMKYGLCLAFLVAFAIKLPVFPFHSWMVRVHAEAPPSIVMIHAGVLLKIGAYGIIRFGMGIFPEQYKSLAFTVVLFGVLSFLYGAFLALVQTDFKLVLAYSSISHMGIVMMGLGALNEAGIQGAIFQVISHGLIAALLFFLVGVLYERTGTTMLPKLGGLARSMPIFSGFMLACGMASLGLPGMSGFISEFMVFLGIFKSQPLLAAIGVIGLVLTAVYVLRAVMLMTFGKNDSLIEKEKRELGSWEFLPALVLLGLIISVGVYPNLLGGPLQGTIEAMILALGGR
ncbi:NuoM family protein [Peribacillus sp. V2I11]|uniref:complex I subunit 4 family protein n=1 Tax=Peribacillus sp. V2I11 TaxID=3042277 RepID=UPI00278A4D04|nr:NADH-quinone oxidoreductase subunit M [Peribacillus sp. V2I11]MDQ0881469.1 NADH-quinone oxidoreductase subunit M [Peribacillus sp. V2I11]